MAPSFPARLRAQKLGTGEFFVNQAKQDLRWWGAQRLAAVPPDTKGPGPAAFYPFLAKARFSASTKPS